MNYTELGLKDFTLGTSARSSVSKETMERVALPMSQKERIALREETVKNFIRSHPAGALIKLQELRKPLSMQPANFNLFIKRLERQGIIVRTDSRPQQAQRRSYAVPEDATSTVPITFKDTPATVLAETKSDVETFNKLKPVSPGCLADKAKNFAWAYPEQHNDLRAFVKWMESHSDESR